MRLRIARLDTMLDPAGEFLVQRKGLFCWHDMYFDSVNKELVVESTEKAIFGDFYLARKYAQAYKNNKPDKILETWEVV